MNEPNQSVRSNFACHLGILYLVGNDLVNTTATTTMLHTVRLLMFNDSLAFAHILSVLALVYWTASRSDTFYLMLMCPFISVQFEGNEIEHIMDKQMLRTRIWNAND